MGTMTFTLPANLPAGAAKLLERAWVSGGPDNMPWPSAAAVAGGDLKVARRTDESGYLVAPWEVDGLGVLAGSTSTLMDRPQPYRLVTELARGKVNQVRCQAFEWESGGLQLAPELRRQIREATRAFGRAVTSPSAEEAAEQAQAALELAYRAADDLIGTYVEQVFRIRKERHAQLDTLLGCRVAAPVTDAEAAAALRRSCNWLGVPLSWHLVEPKQGEYRWDVQDALLDWAFAQNLMVTAGPLVDFSSAQLPGWLWRWERDLSGLASFLCAYVERVVRRYHQRIRSWQVTAASNCGNVLRLGEEELLWLTVRLAEVARQVDPGLELIVGVAQPWGEYMALEERMHSPFLFADTLIRTGVHLAALNLEFVMGPTPRGSFCRDRLDLSRLLDLYALLGVALHVTLGYPSSAAADPEADPEMRVDAGRWRAGYTPEVQADWATDFGTLALAKHHVQAVCWAHFSDAAPHQFPHCGLVDAQGRLKPALERLRQLQEAHL
jgi:hypothetical protein